MKDLKETEGQSLGGQDCSFQHPSVFFVSKQCLCTLFASKQHSFKFVSQT